MCENFNIQLKPITPKLRDQTDTNLAIADMTDKVLEQTMSLMLCLFGTRYII